MTVAGVRGWALERNDRRLAYRVTPEATLFSESVPHRVSLHRHPAWKVVLPTCGLVQVGYGGKIATSAGMIVPPQLTHVCGVSSVYAAFFLDAWVLLPATGPLLLDSRQTQTQTQTVRAALGDVEGREEHADLTSAADVVAGLVGAGAPLDPRLSYAIGAYSDAEPGTRLDDIAAEVGVSATRLRTLAHETVGIPLTRLRQWARLRQAFAEPPTESVAAAAATAGFADQAHFTRTARRLVGRLPSSVRSAPAPPQRG